MSFSSRSKGIIIIVCNILQMKNAKIVIFFLKITLENSTRRSRGLLEVVHQNTQSLPCVLY